MAQTALTEAELIFAKRMLPHFMAGKSANEAAASVIEDDARLATAFFEQGHSQYFPTCDERGSSRYTGTRKGDLIVSEISRTVYERMIAA